MVIAVFSTPVSCEDTTGNGECGNAELDDCGQCCGGNSGYECNSDLDECGVCFGDNYADNCLNSDSCSLMDCNGDCEGQAFMDSCGVCSEGNSLHEANSGIGCDGECFSGRIYDVIEDCCLPEEFDECDQCFGNDWDYCFVCDENEYNIDVCGFGAWGVSVADVPEDQGGRVYMSFNRSFYDTDGLSRSEAYTIERKDDADWVVVQSFGAYGSDMYNVEVNTLQKQSFNRI